MFLFLLLALMSTLSYADDVDCVLGAAVSASDCRASCGTVTQPITTPATGSGECVPGVYACQPGDGSCPTGWRERTLVADQGEDIDGNSGGSNGKTLPECKNWCEQTTGCNSMVWRTEGDCWLKTKVLMADDPSETSATNGFKSYYITLMTREPAMFEYEAFPGYQCKGKPTMRIGAAMEISIETRAADVEACLIACSNNNMCTGVSVAGNYKCYLRTGYVFKKSKAKRTCYEKKITDTYKEDVCTKVAENYLCDSDTCDARIGVEYATKYCNVFASSHTKPITFGECKKACNEDSTCTMFGGRKNVCRLFNGGSRKAIPVDWQKKEPRTTYCYKIIQRFVGPA